MGSWRGKLTAYIFKVEGPVVLEGAKEKTETLKLALPCGERFGRDLSPGAPSRARGHFRRSWPHTVAGGQRGGVAWLGQEPVVSQLLHLVKSVRCVGGAHLIV